MDELTDEAIAALVACSRARPNNESLIVVRTLGGAVARVSPDDSAYPHRTARFNVSIDGVWSDPTDDTAVISWARDTWNIIRPFANGGVYLNFAGLDGDGDVTPRDTLGANLARLERIRSEYDPGHIFQTIAPPA
jgi:FAD/FMN-containing dehydrogenase